MAGAGGGLLTSFLGALQASIAVLLTISYGLIATQFRILSEGSAKDISKLCVRVFLPALLITNVGSELHASTVARYLPILVWSVIYISVSTAVGYVATKAFNFPAWVTPAIAFNNTTSLPLLLVQSLDAAGILSSLVQGDDDTTAEAVNRARSYFLVCAMVSNSLTFALGPKLLDWDEAPDKDGADSASVSSNGDRNQDHENGDVETGEQNAHDNGTRSEEPDESTEETSLLPDAMLRRSRPAAKKVSKRSYQSWTRLPDWLQATLEFLSTFLNAPLIGAAIGAFLGLVPALHKAFFDPTQEGGIFKAWLTSSVENIGELFAALQLVVVGAKLCRSLRKWKQGQASGTVPWQPMLFVFLMRFVLWPLISIPIIWALAAKTNLLDDDPILWFAMMLMPAGPPAITLTSLAEVNDSSEEDVMSIAKFLTVAYLISPLICFPVVGSLKAAEAAIR